MKRPRPQPVVNHPYALARTDDGPGTVVVVKLLDDYPDEGFFLVEGERNDVLHSEVITRSNSRARMEELKRILDEAWEKASVSVADAKAKLDAEFERLGADALLADVDTVLERIVASFKQKRNAHWQAVVDHIAASPIDPLSPETPDA